MDHLTLDKIRSKGLGGAAVFALSAAMLSGPLACRAQVHTPMLQMAAIQSLASPWSPLPATQQPLTIYADGLGSGWQDWSWGPHSLAATLHVHSGKTAIALTPISWDAIYLSHPPFSTTGYSQLELYVYGSSSLRVSAAFSDGNFGPQVPLDRYRQPAPQGGGWTVARIPLSDLGVANFAGVIYGIALQAASNEKQPDVFVDDISLLPGSSSTPAPAPTTVAVTVDASAGRHAISPYIYGMAFAPKEHLANLRLGLNRWGGNAVTRYNWVDGNACNAARDWEWRNRLVTDGNIPPGPSSAADRFIADNRAAGTASLLTIPTIGWVARDADNNHFSIDVPAHGDAPLTTADGAIPGYDPTNNRQRTSIRSAARKGRPFSANPTMADGVIYQDEWVAHLVKRFGDANHGGVRFYSMDNEPDLWDSTHTDIHPARMGYDDMLARFLEYAAAVKAVDPTAQITGPVSWGWIGYLFSSLDAGNDNFQTHADRQRHGGDPFLLWFLKQVQASDLHTGRRTLDVLDVHYYPQGVGLFGGALDPDAQARRLRATRSLWDPTYVDESWIDEPVQLIPRLKSWIAEGYPGTRIGISEWNFGADTNINGALAIADTLGIYGREGVYFANYWTAPPLNSPGYMAFKLYRNADGKAHGFGDCSCQAVSADPNQLSCFAALDTPTGDLTLLLINKNPQATATVPINLKGFQAASGATRMYCLTARYPGVIMVQAGPAPQHGGMTLSLSPSSITLLRVAAAKGRS